MMDENTYGIQGAEIVRCEHNFLHNNRIGINTIRGVIAFRSINFVP